MWQPILARFYPARREFVADDPREPPVDERFAHVKCRPILPKWPTCTLRLPSTEFVLQGAHDSKQPFASRIARPWIASPDAGTGRAGRFARGDLRADASCPAGGSAPAWWQCCRAGTAGDAKPAGRTPHTTECVGHRAFSGCPATCGTQFRADSCVPCRRGEDRCWRACCTDHPRGRSDSGRGIHRGFLCCASAC